MELPGKSLFELDNLKNVRWRVIENEVYRIIPLVTNPNFLSERSGAKTKVT